MYAPRRPATAALMMPCRVRKDEGDVDARFLRGEMKDVMISHQRLNPFGHFRHCGAPERTLKRNQSLASNARFWCFGSPLRVHRSIQRSISCLQARDLGPSMPGEMGGSDSKEIA
jgi:hypothetical protein